MNLLAFLVSVVRITMPYGSAALGGTLSERGGVVNIALEGLMLMGAFAFVAASWATAQALGPAGADTAVWLAPLAGLMAALAAGVLLASVHAVATVWLRADNVVSGLAINIFALGATTFLLKRVFGSLSNSPRVNTFTHLRVFEPGSALEPLNQALHPLVLLTLLMFVAAHFLLGRTRFGLRLRAVGEHPHAADSLGVNVAWHRTAGVLLSGLCASVGGVWLASDQGLFSSGMTNGRGYIALAAMIVGKWRPWGAAAACAVFGLAEATQNWLQVFRQGLLDVPADQLSALARFGAALPNQLIQATPFLLTIIIIAGFVGRSTPPAADGIPFEKERA